MKNFIIKNIFNKDTDKKKIETGIQKTRVSFSEKIVNLFKNNKIDEDLLDELEEILITSDIGVDTAFKVINKLKEEINSRDKEKSQIIQKLKEVISYILSANDNIENIDPFTEKDKIPYVIMVVGINGVGKTTTIGKLANKFKNAGKKVMIGAGDTFRAAAIEQLDFWAKKIDVPIVKQNINSDPAAVAFDTLQSAKSKNIDIVIIDTAGRLHNNLNLMNELKKIKDVMKKVIPSSPNEVMLVIDASTGQNAFEQVKKFSEIVKINSISATKLDGTAKGGVLIGISDIFKIPIKYVGMGEEIDDIFEFDKNTYIDNLFS